MKNHRERKKSGRREAKIGENKSFFTRPKGSVFLGWRRGIID